MKHSNCTAKSFLKVLIFYCLGLPTGVVVGQEETRYVTLKCKVVNYSPEGVLFCGTNSVSVMVVSHLEIVEPTRFSGKKFSLYLDPPEHKKVEKKWRRKGRHVKFVVNEDRISHPHVGPLFSGSIWTVSEHKKLEKLASITVGGDE